MLKLKLSKLSFLVFFSCLFSTLNSFAATITKIEDGIIEMSMSSEEMQFVENGEVFNLINPPKGSLAGKVKVNRIYPGKGLQGEVLSSQEPLCINVQYNITKTEKKVSPIEELKSKSKLIAKKKVFISSEGIQASKNASVTAVPDTNSKSQTFKADQNMLPLNIVINIDDRAFIVRKGSKRKRQNLKKIKTSFSQEASQEVKVDSLKGNPNEGIQNNHWRFEAGLGHRNVQENGVNKTSKNFDSRILYIPESLSFLGLGVHAGAAHLEGKNTPTHALYNAGLSVSTEAKFGSMSLKLRGDASYVIADRSVRYESPEYNYTISSAPHNGKAGEYSLGLAWNFTRSFIGVEYTKEEVILDKGIKVESVGPAVVFGMSF